MTKKMSKQEILAYLCSDREFIYRGRGAAFIPWCNVVGYDNEGKQFNSREEAAEAKVFDGKSIIDIWDEIYPQISYEAPIR